MARIFDWSPRKPLAPEYVLRLERTGSWPLKEYLAEAEGGTKRARGGGGGGLARGRLLIGCRLWIDVGTLFFSGLLRLVSAQGYSQHSGLRSLISALSPQPFFFFITFGPELSDTKIYEP